MVMSAPARHIQGAAEQYTHPLTGVIKFALIIVNNFISHFNRSIKAELLIYEYELRH